MKFYKLWVSFLFSNLYPWEFLQKSTAYNTYSWGFSSQSAKKMAAPFKILTAVTKKNAVKVTSRHVFWFKFTDA